MYNGAYPELVSDLKNSEVDDHEIRVRVGVSPTIYSGEFDTSVGYCRCLCFDVWPGAGRNVLFQDLCACQNTSMYGIVILLVKDSEEISFGLRIFLDVFFVFAEE